MTNLADTTGIVLAGGAGSRVGGRDKGLLPWHGKPLVAHVAERLAPQVNELLISCNRNAEQYARYCSRTLADTRRDFQGPLAGLEAAAGVTRTEFLIIAPCDTPQLPLDLGGRLLAALRQSAAAQWQISYAHDGQREQYLCAAIRTSCLSSLSGFLDEGHRAVRHWYSLQRSVAVDFSDQAGSFENYNRL